MPSTASLHPRLLPIAIVGGNRYAELFKGWRRCRIRKWTIAAIGFQMFRITGQVILAENSQQGDSVTAVV